MSIEIQDIAGAWLRVFEPPPRMTVAEWAEDRRYLSPESCANPGKYATDMTPFAVEPMNSVNDPEATGTVLMWGSQLGKTEVTNNVIGYFVDIEPAPLLMVQPTIDLAESWSKERLAPMVRDTPALTGKVADVRSRDAGNTILHKSFPGGNMAVAGANAPSGLASRPRRVVIQDEIDRFPPSAGSEGDPSSIADRRTESFWNAVLFKTSTPTIKGRSRIESEWEVSSKGRWTCPCPRCGHEQPLKWSQVRWETEDGSDAWYQCEGCDEHLSDDERRGMVRAGRWVHERPERGLKGYHLNGINSLFRHKKGYKSRLHQMVAERNSAKTKGPEVLKTWVNTFLAETWEDDGEAVDWEPLMARRENWGEFPAGGLIVTAGLDIQADRVEIEFAAWGVGEESWSLAHVIVVGDFDKPEIQRDVDTELQRTWTHPVSGVRIPVSAALVDSGHKTKSVYKFTKRRAMRRIHAVKGKGGPGRPVLSRPTKQGVERALLFTAGTDTIKDSIYSRLTSADVGPGYMHFPSDRGEDYFRQLTAEKRVTRWQDGVPYSKFENPSKTRNEALDLRVYATAALALMHVDWEKLRKAVATPKESDDEEKPKKKRRRREGGGWVNSW